VQYLTGGLALCLFYLLLLSLSEHIGFVGAYAIASAAVVGQSPICAGRVWQRCAGGDDFAGMLVALYAFLFVLLHVQDYALLVGFPGSSSSCLLKYTTRKVDCTGWPARTAGLIALAPPSALGDRDAAIRMRMDCHWPFMSRRRLGM